MTWCWPWAHQWKEVKRELVYFWKEVWMKAAGLPPGTNRTRIYYECKRCGKKKLERVDGDWT